MNKATQIVQHPTTDKLFHMALLALAALVYAKAPQLQQPLSTLQAFAASSQVHAALLALLAVFSAVKSGLARPAQPTAYLQTATLGTAAIQLAPAPVAALLKA